MTGTLAAALVTVTVLCVAANAGIAVADLAGAKFVTANSAEVGLPAWAVPPLAVLKAAGAIGLVAGFAGFPLLGLAAACGLTAFFVGAVAAHVRAKVWHNIAFPLAYLALAAGALAYFAAA